MMIYHVLSHLTQKLSMSVLSRVGHARVDLRDGYPVAILRHCVDTL
jgi:hypothetical protein